VVDDEIKRSKSAAQRAAEAYGDAEGGRQKLIAEALSTHRKKQSVLSDLDDETRRKLAATAEKLLPKSDEDEG
jgi:hypothetical protein